MAGLGGSRHRVSSGMKIAFQPFELIRRRPARSNRLGNAAGPIERLCTHAGAQIPTRPARSPCDVTACTLHKREMNFS
jgi:hypothetical protein